MVSLRILLPAATHIVELSELIASPRVKGVIANVHVIATFDTVLTCVIVFPDVIQTKVLSGLSAIETAGPVV
jgi:hypothetical protein